jgi:hypothetical protein
VDNHPSAIDRSAVETSGAQALPAAASDRHLPFGWLLPWLLALAGILITLALTR